MIKATTRINNKLGLHARASAKLTKLAGGFRCEIFLARNGRRVNAKSIMGVMMLAAGKGSSVIVDTEGERADEALQTILDMIASKFGEAE
ncbi:MAG: HPr family phosphocarrier protein [Burkholderiales bacterium]|nr:HPr family phosphocarrier protein [Burkholderiales bacterium]